MRFPDCDFDLLEEVDAYALLHGAIGAGDGYSFVRLGDGEGVLLSLQDDHNPRDIQYLRQHLGDAANVESVRIRLKQLLLQSIEAADLIGIRDDIAGVKFDLDLFAIEGPEFLDSFKRHFKLREPEQQLGPDGARRIALLHRALSRIDFRSSHAFCSAWIHYKLHSSGALLDLLRRQQRVGVITCRSDVPKLLSELLGLEVAFHPIPDMYRNIPAPLGPEDYLDPLEALLHKRLVEFPGMMFLVGGGFYGKAYCHHIKAQGGIALDVGSLLDAWVGIPSRPTVYAADYRDTPRLDGVPTTLLLNDASVKRSVGRDPTVAL